MLYMCRICFYFEIEILIKRSSVTKKKKKKNLIDNRDL